VEALRVLPPVDGHDVFSEREGTKHLKPDLEAAVALGPRDALLLGSGSSAARTRLARVAPGGPAVRDVAPLFAAVARALELPAGTLNLEGACLVGWGLRWFQRGAAHVPSASVDVDLAALLTGGPVRLSGVRRYDLGDVDGVPLAVTDAVALPDGRVLVSTAAEDTSDPVDDGPVVASGLALLADDRVVASVLLPATDGQVHKVEGLTLLPGDGLRLLAVVDADDEHSASTALHLRVSLS
jgi:hypothetical protein